MGVCTWKLSVDGTLWVLRLLWKPGKYMGSWEEDDQWVRIHQDQLDWGGRESTSTNLDLRWVFDTGGVWEEVLHNMIRGVEWKMAIEIGFSGTNSIWWGSRESNLEIPIHPMGFWHGESSMRFSIAKGVSRSRKLGSHGFLHMGRFSPWKDSWHPAWGRDPREGTLVVVPCEG